MNSAKEVADLIKQWKDAGTDRTELVVKDAEAKIGWPYCWGATGQYCTVANRKAKMANQRITDGDRELIRQRCQVLNGSRSSCEGCAYFPDGEKTRIYDCIGFINSLLDDAGIAHSGAGCTTMWNTAKNWQEKGTIANLPEMVCLVFQKDPREANKMQHIGLYIGDGMVIHCSKTVKKQKLSAYPWSHYGVLVGLGGDVPVPTTKPTLRKGDSGPYVVECQEDLIQLRYDLSPYGADGKYGNKTISAVKAFQRDHGLAADGICGPKTWEALDAAVGPGPGPQPEELYTVTIMHVTKSVAEEIKGKYGGEMTKE